MCKPFSCLILESGEVAWKWKVDSHEDLIKSLKLADDGRKQSFVRVEITPKNGSYLTPDEWIYRVDQDDTPTWYKAEYAEGECRKAHKRWLARLNRVIIRKPIINPLAVKPHKVTAKDKANLKKWVSVGASGRDSVGASVAASVADSVGVSVGASVWDSVADSGWASVGGAEWAYSGSFFRIPNYKFQCAVDLWERGFVASFDGKTWRLHAGPKAEIVYQIDKEKM